MQKGFIGITIILLAVSAGSGLVTVPEPLRIGSFMIREYEEETEFTTAQQYSQMSIVGDVMLARHVEKYLNVYGSDYVYSQLPTLASTTILLGNFEASIPEVHIPTPANTFRFSVDTVHIPALAAYGFSHMSLANNHTFDSGRDGFQNLQTVLSETGITHMGSPILSSTSVTYIEIQDVTVAVLALYALDQSPEKELMDEVLHEASDKSDYLFVYVHWGTEYDPVHSLFQETLAHELIDGGADAIFGHHPHVVQDIELYNGALIFYSLGNFIFDQYFSKEVQEGLQVNVSFDNEVPVYSLNGVSSIGSRSAPRLMRGYEQNMFLKELARKSSRELSEGILSGEVKK